MPTSPAASRIKDAYLKLLERFPCGPITVTQVAQQAKVNRVTFYRLYETQEAVLLDILDEFTESNQVFMDELDPSGLYDIPVRQMLEHHRRNMPMLRTVLLSSMAPVLERRIENGVRDPVSSTGALSDMMLSFYVAGVSKVICDWIRGGCAESIDEIIRFFFESNAMLKSR
ncbi:MAG: TetR family transcriptional regulator C-terminal domain-containing protein [Atopobiaceae bacterium]|nr:TetR family transcriptional regulator C-terminal domain-containing protein [Atopobiaceae bacterium]